MIEWKVTVNKRVISRDTEEDFALTLSAFWPVTLRRKLEKLLESKTTRKSRVRTDDTWIVVSVNDRSQRDLTKRFDNLDVEWTAVGKQLLRWGGTVKSRQETKAKYYLQLCWGRSFLQNQLRGSREKRQDVSHEKDAQRTRCATRCRGKRAWQ